MKYYIGTTDFGWYSYLSRRSPEDVNFWQPGGKAGFRVLSPGAPFLFKLKSPYNAIVGLGFFSSHTFLPISVAWDAYCERNSCGSFEQFRRMITTYRTGEIESNPTIGCIVLTNPLFFSKEDWIEQPEDWARSIVQGKSYDTTSLIGANLWERIERLMDKYLVNEVDDIERNQL